MKSLILFCLLLMASLNFGCRNEKSIEEQMDPKTTRCYSSISKGDTAYLSIDTANHRIIGLLEFKYSDQKKIYKGQFEGSMHKDTLMGHFDFKINNVDKWYRNPVAFLKRNEQLTMGVGQFSMVWGSAYFDAKVPVDYEKGRFIFEPGDCLFKNAK